MKRVVFSLAVLLATHVAHADPIALRGPDTGAGVAATLGYPEFSVGAWVLPRVGVAIDVRYPFSAIGAHVATRGVLLGRTLGWGMDAFASGGVILPTVQPGVALGATLALHLRGRTEGFYAAFGVVAPMALQLAGEGGVLARIPIAADLWLAFRAGPMWLGLQSNIGATFVPGISPTPALQASLFVAVPWSQPVSPTGSTTPPAPR